MFPKKLRQWVAVIVILLLYPVDKRLAVLLGAITATLIYLIPNDNPTLLVVIVIYGAIMGYIIGSLIAADIELGRKRRVK